ncbi:MAG TPA: flagellar basal body-associated FliL family protein [Burkholderiales bacterium]|nr:flagellar basal body-associated FliL family protein [Burkholderiales bacterium]
MEKTETAPDAPAAAPRKGGKKLLVSILALVIVAGGGAAAWYVLKSRETTKPEVKAQPVVPVYAALDTFTVNLLSDDGQNHHLQTNITLELGSPEVEQDLKQREPAIRNAILLLLSSKTSAELLTTDGKKKLADEVLATVNTTLSSSQPGPVAAPPAVAAPATPPVAALPAAAPEATPPQTAAPPATAPRSSATTAGGVNAPGPVRGVLFTAFIID